MKLYKIIFPIILILTFIITNYFLNISSKTNNISITSNKEEFIKKLTHGLNLANISAKNITINSGFDQIIFISNKAKIIFSLNKNPYSQIATLQQAQKIATIKKQQLLLVDLSLEHPYASF